MMFEDKPARERPGVEQRRNQRCGSVGLSLVKWICLLIFICLLSPPRCVTAFF
jgi:hypothetical protein